MALNIQKERLYKSQAYIDGRWVDADNGAREDVFDPATGDKIGDAPFMGAEEATRAVDAAAAAFPAWKAMTPHERADIMLAWHDLIIENQDALARIMTAECGKPLAQSVGEVVYGAAFIKWFAEEGKRVYGETIPAKQRDRRIIVTKEPAGVTAAITPWNFPSACVTRKIAPALAAGCTQVLKPAPDTPYSALALAALAEEAGLPAGVLNVVTGDAPAIGGVLTSHDAIRVLTFTGSTPVGKLLAEQCARRVIKTSLELGGNAPFIVFDDADLDDAVEEVIASKFRNSGQTCVCANRILVQASVFDAFAEKLAARVEAFTVGPGDAKEGVDIGPLINAAGFQKVARHVDDAVAKGATVLTGGAAHPLGGNFYKPTVLAGAHVDMQLAEEETFGPVAPLYRFDTEEEAVNYANATRYGLSAYIYTKDLSRAFRVSEALESGMVGVNAGVLSNEVAPFGGVKESGIGREGSRHGIEEFVEMKYVHFKIS
ncbi:MAG: NAD-dependent succinate-semialdehyde dehydrogenase [Pseudomonadota bacterium]